MNRKRVCRASTWSTTNRRRFLDYTEKYANTGNVSFVVPAPLSKSMTTKIQRMAIQAFQSVDGAGLARVDFFLPRNGGELVINELNTMPGLTEVSGYPKMWEASGLPFPRVAGDAHRTCL